MLNQVVSLARLLQSNTDPRQIAFGAVLGLFFGFTPSGQTHLIVLVLLFFLLKINRGAAMLTFVPAKLIYLTLLWPLADRLGYYLLTDSPVPARVWSFAVQAPVLALLRLDHTLVLGGMTLAAAAGVPVFIGVMWAVHAYRASFAERVGRWNAVKALQGFSIVKWFVDRWGK